MWPDAWGLSPLTHRHNTCLGHLHPVGGTPTGICRTSIRTSIFLFFRYMDCKWAREHKTRKSLTQGHTTGLSILPGEPMCINISLRRARIQNLLVQNQATPAWLLDHFTSDIWTENEGKGTTPSRWWSVTWRGIGDSRRRWFPVKLPANVKLPGTTNFRQHNHWDSPFF